MKRSVVDQDGYTLTMDVSSAHFGFDATGAPMSGRYGDIYRSRHGALAESHAVFVEGASLRRSWSGRSDFTVLEIGFGLGLNCLAAAQALLAEPSAPKRLHMVSLEAHPLCRSDLEQAHRALGLADEPLLRDLRAAWPMRLPGLHRLSLAGGRIFLLLGFGEAEHLLPRLSLRADAVFLDGFAPARNPSAWSVKVIKQIARHVVRGATLATYTSASSVREALEQSGFEVTRVPGFAMKRERLNACYKPRWRTWPEPEKPAEWVERHVAVIGAGLAGCELAAVMGGRGWKVDLFESHSRPLPGGSSQPWLAEHPHLSPDDNVTARLTRAALGLRSDRLLTRLRVGRLALAESESAFTEQTAMLSRLAFPEGFARMVDADEAGDLAGVHVPQGGIWLPECAIAQPGELAHTMPRSVESAIRLHCNTVVATLAHEGERWCLRGVQGEVIGRFPLVVVCSATYLPGLDLSLLPALRRSRGQTSWVRDSRLAGLKAVLGAAAYAVPDGGRVLVGATYDEEASPAADAANNHSNLQRLARALHWDMPSGLTAVSSASVGFRWNASDRLPVIGQWPDPALARDHARDLLRNDRLLLPRLPGLFIIAGLGSRGLLWSALAAEVLSAHLEGWPAPIEADLLRAIDPARQVRSQLRRERVALS